MVPARSSWIKNNNYVQNNILVMHGQYQKGNRIFERVIQYEV